MKLLVNGEPRELDGETASLDALLASLDLDGKAVVVEHNRKPVLPQDYTELTLGDGDELEIVRIAAGG